jgi:hypothetical protein
VGGAGIGVELEGSAESDATVGGADVEDVAGVAGAGVAGRVDVVHDIVERGRLAPAHVSPVSGAAVHGSEEAGRAAPGACEGGAGERIGPSDAAVGRAVDLVGPVSEAPTHLVHRGDVDVARGQVADDLDVAKEVAGAHLDWAAPSETVVSRTDGEDVRVASIKVVPGNVHASKEWAARVVVRPARLPVVAAAVVNAEMGPAIRIPWSCGLEPAETLTAARLVEPNGEPSCRLGGCTEQRGHQRGTGEGALTAGGGEPDEGVATIGGDRSAGDVDGGRVAPS